jgi:DNA polymerase II large subunit
MNYADMLKEGLNAAYAYASKAREKGLDPTTDVEIKITADIAARVESITGPPHISSIIRTLERGGASREDIAFKITKEIATGNIIKGSKEMLIEQAVRTGTAILTEGVLVAPTEGIAKVKIKNNPDGSDYVAVYYAGPIRSAGGTAVALTVVLADIARRTIGISDYRPTDTQIERYVEEINLYEARVAHLQYKPPEDDVRWIVRNCPVCIDGEPTEEIEVSAYRNIPGVETNYIRGGIPLVICEGIAQKAAKLLRYTKKLELGWDWLEKLIKITREESKNEIRPDDTYLEGLVAGRPVFSYPSAKGGFRVRYGKSRTNGMMARNIHPATMVLLEGFLTYGTHMKVERPGKGCVLTPYEKLDAPVVRLKDGSVIKVESEEMAKKYLNDVEEILYLGDILVTYGDFLKSAHPLVASAWCEEWWEKELEAKNIEPPNTLSAESLFQLSKIHDVPLHPLFTYHWHDITPQQLKELVEWLEKDATIVTEKERIREMVIKLAPAKKILEELLVPHRVVGEMVTVDGENATALLLTLCMKTTEKEQKLISPKFDEIFSEDKSVLEMVNELSGVKIKMKAPTYVGARMGRPEKAKERAMDGSPNVLFPTGSQMRSIMRLYRTAKAVEGNGKTITLELSRRRCVGCSSITPFLTCHLCGNKTIQEYKCQKCNANGQMHEHCGVKTLPFEQQNINIVKMLEEARKVCDVFPQDLKGVKGLSNPTRIPERLEKGLLRAKHNVYVFRDGTARFDSTNVPLTHFYPKEVGVSVEKLRELGYDKDYKNETLKSDEQLVQLKQQDIILSEKGAEYFIRVAAFIDDMLVNFYKMKPFYNVRKKEDLIGHLVIALSPHTSAGVLARIIGFTKAHVCYAHPFLIAAKRRNCDGDEDSVMLLLDALMNFSRAYLDEKRGGTMDAPLVLMPSINPKEIDDEAHCIEFLNSYPLEFYHATERNALPGEVKIRTVKDMLNDGEQCVNIPLTHVGGKLDEGKIRSTYVELGSIPEKIALQFKLQGKIRAVDKKNAAERLIISHFIPDLYGNLRSFYRQNFRCVSCNRIYRRPPLIGKCLSCGGNLILTINKGGIEKYLQLSKKIVEDYDLPLYLKQRLELVEKEIKAVFEDDKIKQLDLTDFI